MKEKIKSIEEGVHILMDRAELKCEGWKYAAASENGLWDRIIFESGKEVPLFVWRYHQKLNSIKKASVNVLGKLCSVKTYSFVPRIKKLESLIYQELDLSQWWLDSKIEHVMAFMGGMKAVNLIARMKNGTVATLELSNTLPEDAVPQCKHTLYSTHGMACDRVVDTQVVQEAVYLYTDGKKPDTFTDTDIMLYGLTPAEIDTVYCIYAILNGTDDADKIISDDKKLRMRVKDVYRSAKNGSAAFAGEAE